MEFQKEWLSSYFVTLSWVAFFPSTMWNIPSVLLVNAAAFAAFAAVDADAAWGADLGGDVSADLVKRGWCCWRCCQCESLCPKLGNKNADKDNGDDEEVDVDDCKEEEEEEEEKEATYDTPNRAYMQRFQPKRLMHDRPGSAASA